MSDDERIEVLKARVLELEIALHTALELAPHGYNPYTLEKLYQVLDKGCGNALL